MVSDQWLKVAVQIGDPVPCHLLCQIWVHHPSILFLDLSEIISHPLVFLGVVRNHLHLDHLLYILHRKVKYYHLRYSTPAVSAFQAEFGSRRVAGFGNELFKFHLAPLFFFCACCTDGSYGFSTYLDGILVAHFIKELGLKVSDNLTYTHCCEVAFIMLYAIKQPLQKVPEVVS